MKLRAIKRRHDARTLQQAMAERAFFERVYSDPHFDGDWYEEDDEFNCTRCAGTGFMEADDPLWEDADEFGEVECGYCGGTGLREHQSIF